MLPKRQTGAADLSLSRVESDRYCQAVISKTPLTQRRSPGADAATAGGMVVGAMLICAALGFGLGSLVDLSVPGGLLGLFGGLALGFALVYRRYRRI